MFDAKNLVALTFGFAAEWQLSTVPGPIGCRAVGGVLGLIVYFAAMGATRGV